MIGVLDSSAVNELREILAVLASQAGIGLTVDLTDLDDQHHLIASALLSVAARRLHDQGSTVTARNPPRRPSRDPGSRPDPRHLRSAAR
jgi:imidazoleglycerol phosphate dehydratase HisB